VNAPQPEAISYDICSRAGQYQCQCVCSGDLRLVNSTVPAA